VQRFFLGFLESAVAPSFVILCSQFYKTSEQALRIAAFWSASGVSSMVGPFISYGFALIPGTLKPWQNIFMFAGILTIFWSVVLWFFLPDDPTRAKFFNDRERFVALERVRDNNSGIVSHVYKWAHVKEVLKDVQVWLCVTITFAVVSNNAITGTFASIIISNLGYNALQSLALQVPSGFWGVSKFTRKALMAKFVIACGPALLISKTNNYRLVIFTILGVISIAGSAILYAAPKTSTGLLLAGYYLNNCYVAMPNLLFSLVAANIGGRTKKGLVNALVFCAYCCGSFSPLYFQAQDNYHGGFLAILICTSYGVAAAQLLQVLYRRRNNKRNAIGDPTSDLAFSDKTDLDNPNFRYSY
jgi:sugar phosphate permease